MLPQSIKFTTPPTYAQWILFLGRAGLVLALLLCSSAVITVIAANWSHIPKVWRIGGVQALIILLLGLSVYVGRRSPTAWTKSYSPAALLLTSASVVVGGLFALLGQSYQTGADPWQLFALWAVVLMPWLWASRSLIIALLWVVLLNLSLYLWLDARQLINVLWLLSLGSVWPMVVLNLVLAVLAERLHLYAGDSYRILPRTVLALLVSVVMFEVVHWLSADDDIALLSIGLSGLLSAGLWYRYLHKEATRDVLVGCLTYGLIFFLSIAVLMYLNVYDAHNLFLFMLLHGVVAYFMVRDLTRKLRSIKAQERDQAVELEGETVQVEPLTDAKQPWFLRLFRIVIMMFLGVLLSAYIGMSIGVDIPYVAEILMILGFVTAVLLARGNDVWKQDIAAVTLVSGMIFGVLSHVTSTGELLGLRLFVYGLLGVVLYAFSKSWPMRFFSSVWAIAHGFAWVLYGQEYGLYVIANEGVSSTLRLEIYAVIFIVTALILADLAHRSVQNYNLLSPAMWASLIASFVAVMPLPALWGFGDEGGLSFQWAFSSTVLLLLPSLCLYAGLKRSQVKGRGAITALVALFVSTLLWSGFPALPLALAWGALAYYWRNTALQILIALAIVVALGVLYYSLHLSLNQKALLLVLTGLCLGLLSMLLPKVRAAVAKAKKSNPQLQPLAYRQSLLVLGLVLCLGLANYDVWSKERILRNGQSVVLELAPVDPRSLMQGDYMVLRYRLDGDLTATLRNPALSSERWQDSLWVWLAPDEQGVAWHLAAIQSVTFADRLYWLENKNAKPGDAVLSIREQGELDLTDLGLVKMRVRNGARGWSPGSNAWFFAEGQAERFDNAKYGEFAVDGGVALLRNMLNAQGEPIE